MRPWEWWHTDRQTQTDFITCPIAICYSYGADNKYNTATLSQRFVGAVFAFAVLTYFVYKAHYYHYYLQCAARVSHRIPISLSLTTNPHDNLILDPNRNNKTVTFLGECPWNNKRIPYTCIPCRKACFLRFLFLFPSHPQRIPTTTTSPTHIPWHIFHFHFLAVFPKSNNGHRRTDGRTFVEL